MSPKGPYPKGVAKREEILRTALAIFSREGYRGTSLREVARSCGLSLPGLMHYFDSKEDLLAAILKKRDEHDFAAQHEVGGDPFKTISGVMRHNAEVPGLVQLYATLSAAASDPAHPAHDFFVGRYRDFRVTLAETLRERQSAGLLAADRDAEKLAAIIIAVADGLQVQWMLEPGIDMAGHIDYLVSLIDIVAPPPSSGE
ncbi:TetR/AcrR family transcriptional regulator [Paeniglutamicibacter kerguelensis]|uniref:AcrR family transcriptional regulator n=1 Tax=Paeniglutamicibacter kerguelensis TaxID=254788 RepID=A0ABS4XEA5_9MICC|nr:TetR/AcrR family transcriptional regulator [Paeniglutamicibacter kerguelensis]MBP2386004.1 AcrR family transcriptional regulator [Paeniglutamicibacter kerguelensis]